MGDMGAYMYGRILVTLDGSLLARAAIRYAAGLAEETGTEVVLFEAIESVESLRSHLVGEAYEFTGGRPEAIADLAESQHFVLREAAIEETDRAASELRGRGIAVTTDVAEGLPGNAILAAADRHAVDAIVMATRGRGGLGRDVVGSVAEYVLRHAGARAVILAGTRAPASEQASAPTTFATSA